MTLTPTARDSARTTLAAIRPLNALPGALLAHRSDLTLRGLTLAVGSVVDIYAAHTSFPPLLADLARCAPAMVLMEDRLSDRAGCTAIEQIYQVRALVPHARLILVGRLYDGVYVGDLLAAGAHGYLCTADALGSLLPDAIQAVMNGGRYLSASASADCLSLLEQRRRSGRRDELGRDERQALALLLEGYDVPETMRCLNVNRARVYHLHHRLRTRYGVSTNEALIRCVLWAGLPVEAAN